MSDLRKFMTIKATNVDMAMSTKPHDVAGEEYFTEGEAFALAQLAKRICFVDLKGLSSSEEEAYQMRDAVVKLKQVLADAGAAPR